MMTACHPMTDDFIIFTVSLISFFYFTIADHGCDQVTASLFGDFAGPLRLIHSRYVQSPLVIKLKVYKSHSLRVGLAPFETNQNGMLAWILHATASAKEMNRQNRWKLPILQQQTWWIDCNWIAPRQPTNGEFWGMMIIISAKTWKKTKIIFGREQNNGIQPQHQQWSKPPS